MAKSFKKSNPLDNIDTTEATEITPGNETPVAAVPEPTAKNVEKKYLRLDITDNQDYISLMASHSSMSMTKYINKLIESDKKKNKNTYEKLKEVEQEIQRLKKSI